MPGVSYVSRTSFRKLGHNPSKTANGIFIVFETMKICSGSKLASLKPSVVIGLLRDPSMVSLRLVKLQRTLMIVSIVYFDITTIAMTVISPVMLIAVSLLFRPGHFVAGCQLATFSRCRL